MSTYGRQTDAVSDVVSTLMPDESGEDRAEVFSRLMEDRALYLIVAALLERGNKEDSQDGDCECFARPCEHHPESII